MTPYNRNRSSDYSSRLVSVEELFCIILDIFLCFMSILESPSWKAYHVSYKGVFAEPSQEKCQCDINIDACQVMLSCGGVCEVRQGKAHRWGGNT